MFQWVYNIVRKPNQSVQKPDADKRRPLPSRTEAADDEPDEDGRTFAQRCATGERLDTLRKMLSNDATAEEIGLYIERESERDEYFAEIAGSAVWVWLFFNSGVYRPDLDEYGP